MTTILAKAVKRYWNERRLLEANAAWSRILDVVNSRAEIEAEDKLWDQTVADGLTTEPW